MDTPAFASVQPEMRAEIYAQVQRILSATTEQLPDDYPQLDLALRRQILEFLRSTVADWPRVS